MTPLSRLAFAPVLVALVSACSSAQFTGAAPAKGTGQDPQQVAAAPGDNPTPPVPVAPTSPTPPATTPPTCVAGSNVAGARIAFLVDNSGSNSQTDCPAAHSAGTTNGTDSISVCGTQTAREAAVLASYDLLAQVAVSHPSDAASMSQLTIASFPTATDVWTGWTAQTADWVNTDAAHRDSIASSLLFARSPRGMTPFSAAIDAATQFFAKAPQDGRSKVAVLLSDGEATDSNPGAVAAKAAALTQSGVNVFVMIYGGSLASHAQSDSVEMQRLDAASVKAGKGHWYDASYPDFASYAQALIGSGGQGGLANAIASKPQNVVQLQDASALSTAIQSLIVTNALQNCTP